MKTVDCVVVGKNYQNMLGIIKSVGEAGYSCGVLSHTKEKLRFLSPELKSRYAVCSSKAEHCNENDIVKKLLSDFPISDRAVLIPADDWSAVTVDRHREELEAKYLTFECKAVRGGIVGSMDKALQKELCRQLGIPSADFAVMHLAAGGHISIPELRYPCIVKPRASFGIDMSKRMISVCNSEKELEERLICLAESFDGQDVLAEEYLKVDDEYTVPGVSLRGGDQVVIPYVLRKSCVATGNGYGITVSGDILPASSIPRLAEKASEYMREIAYTGIFDIELFRCGGSFYFNELNMRSSAAMYASTGAGANIPGIYVDSLLKDGMTITTDEPNYRGSFVNEQAALEEYKDGSFSWREYLALKRNCDIRFLTGDDDAPACRSYRMLEIRSHFVKLYRKGRKRLT